MVLPVCGDLAGTRRPGRHSIRSLSIACYAARGVANAGALLAVLFLTPHWCSRPLLPKADLNQPTTYPPSRDRYRSSIRQDQIVLGEGDVVDAGMVREMMAQPYCQHLW
jgi:hypothetical protein